MSAVLPLSITVSGLSRLYAGDLAKLADLGPMAEDAGVHSLVMTDHLAIGPRLDRYPYGRFPFGADEPWPEPLLTLAVLAGRTARVRLGTGILIAPLRPALLLAKSAATLDALSGGRLDLGVGVGWQPEEYAAAGVPFEGRYARMLDTLRACRALWRDAPAQFASSSVAFEEVGCLPRPAQDPLPLWFGLRATPRNAARIAELGQGWMPIGSDPAALAADVTTLREAFAEAGRDPAELGVRAAPAVRLGSGGRPDLEATLAGLPALAESGATVAAVALAAFAGRPEELPGFFSRLARASRA